MHGRPPFASQPGGDCVPARAQRRAVFRCDGGERIGAGHVARCLALARAFSRWGWQTSFAGAYDGLAEWLLERSGVMTAAPDPLAPCGVDPGGCELAIVDSYTIATAAICELAAAMPVLTLAEAVRCPHLGILLDYHLDRAPQHGPRLLAGPAYAPLDRAFAAAGRPGSEVRTLLISVGGSRATAGPLEQIAGAAAAAFPDAQILLAAPGGPAEREIETHHASNSRMCQLPRPSSLLAVVAQIDLAITAAGLTSYELACAGVPQLAIAVAANQRRVIDGLRRHHLAMCLDLTDGERLGDLPAALRRMRDPALRRDLSERGMRVFDGRGAERVASALSEMLLQPPANEH